MHTQKDIEGIIKKSIEDESFFRGYVVSEIEAMKKTVSSNACRINLLEKIVYIGVGGVSCINIFVLVFSFLKNNL